MNGLAWRAAQIPAEIENTLSDAIDENGEISNEVALAKLESLTREKTVALTDLGSFVKEDLDVKIGHLDDMIGQLTAQQNRLMKAREICTRVIGELLPVGDKAETPFVKLSWKNNPPSVEVGIPPELLPEKYQRIVPAKVEANKKALAEDLKALKDGETIEGARLVQKVSLQIK